MKQNKCKRNVILQRLRNILWDIKLGEYVRMFLQNLSEKGRSKLILSRKGDKDYIYCNTCMCYICMYT